MYLSEDEAQIFYKLWLSLLEYTNNKYKLNSKIKKLVSAKSINPQDLIPIKNKLWEDKNLIDEYLNRHCDLHSYDEIEIIKGFKRNITGKYIILKHLKKYTIFMSTDDEAKAYGVIGISNPIDMMFPSYILPIYVEAVLLPFKEKIIYDSLILPYNITLGSGIKKGLNEDYKNSKEKYGIITTI